MFDFIGAGSAIGVWHPEVATDFFVKKNDKKFLLQKEFM